MDTPVTVLYELCCRKLEGIQPDYKWIHHEGQVHKPTFYVRLEVSDVVVVTHASSKKKAKQVAALAALRTLASKLNDIRSLEFVDKYKEDVVIPDDTGISHKSSGDTKTSDETEVNSVGSLQTVCMKNHWRPPEYKTTDTIGPPHDRSFTVSCEVYPEGIKILKQGSGKSLRVAKRNAAMEILNQMVSNGTIDTIGVNTDKTDKESPENESMDDYSSPVSVYSGQPVLDLLQDINLDDENVKSDRDWVKILTDAAPGLKASLEILDMPNKNDSDNLFRVLIKLNPLNVENTHQPTIPLMTSWGVGTTRDNAIRDAAARSIQLLNM